jgi:hypothetical protein
MTGPALKGEGAVVSVACGNSPASSIKECRDASCRVLILAARERDEGCIAPPSQTVGSELGALGCGAQGCDKIKNDAVTSIALCKRHHLPAPLWPGWCRYLDSGYSVHILHLHT